MEKNNQDLLIEEICSYNAYVFVLWEYLPSFKYKQKKKLRAKQLQEVLDSYATEFYKNIYGGEVAHRNCVDKIINHIDDYNVELEADFVIFCLLSVICFKQLEIGRLGTKLDMTIPTYALALRDEYLKDINQDEHFQIKYDLLMTYLMKTSITND